MSFIVVDVEADGQVPGINSMVCFGAVVVDEKLDKKFYGQTKPISTVYDPDALAVSGFSRKEHEKFEDPGHVMPRFADWLHDTGNGRPILISDNNGFDAAYINYYFHVFHGKNPFGWSSRRIGDLYCGVKGDLFAKWKGLRKTKHTHHPVDDALGNAEALLEMEKLGYFKLPK